MKIKSDRRSVVKIAAASGAALVLGGGSESASARVGTARQDMWRAWAVTKGDKTRLVVEGIYSQGGGGRVAVLKPGTQGINHKILILDLSIKQLPGAWPMVIFPIPAHYTLSPYQQGQYDSIVIKYRDDTERSESIERIADAGSGPKGAEEE